MDKGLFDKSGVTSSSGTVRFKPKTAGTGAFSTLVGAMGFLVGSGDPAASGPKSGRGPERQPRLNNRLRRVLRQKLPLRRTLRRRPLLVQKYTGNRSTHTLMPGKHVKAS